MSDWWATTPRTSRYILFGWVERVNTPQIAPLFHSGDGNLPHHWSVVRAIHPLHLPPKLYCLAWGVFLHQVKMTVQSAMPICRKPGCNFCQRRPWSAMVVMVVVGCWRLVMSDFLFLHRLTMFFMCDTAAKKRDLGERIFTFRWVSCPGL